MLEKYIVEHCAPTLASIKTANLFSIKSDDFSFLNDEVAQLNSVLGKKGLCVTVLKKCNDLALIYVYRPEGLRQILNDKEIFNFLKKFGYCDNSVEKCISFLKNRIACFGNFPHEIGIFLGYPLCDVYLFIKNRGNNFKCCGCWKVYCNEQECLETFKKYNKCTQIYSRLWKNGLVSLNSLAVAV